MELRDHVGGWFLAPNLQELKVDDHHLAVLRDPAAYGLTSEEVETIGPRNRVGILTAVLRNGWIRIRVPPTHDAVIHIEVWVLDRARARRIESWIRRRGPWPAHHPVRLGVLGSGESFATVVTAFRLRLRQR